MGVNTVGQTIGNMVAGGISGDGLPSISDKPIEKMGMSDQEISDALNNLSPISLQDDYSTDQRIIGGSSHPPESTEYRNSLGSFTYDDQGRVVSENVVAVGYREGTSAAGATKSGSSYGIGDFFNEYAYVGNDPTDKTDPSGLEVESAFYKGAGLVVARDSDTGVTAISEAFSGAELNTRTGIPGPPYSKEAPNGFYDILGSYDKHNQSNWRLEMADSRWGDDKTSDGTTQVRLHTNGHVSHGCVDLVGNKGGGAVDRLLKNTRPGQTPDGWRRTGYMVVTSGDGGWRYNRQTGEVFHSATTTGSRIPQWTKVCTMKNGQCGR